MASLVTPTPISSDPERPHAHPLGRQPRTPEHVLRRTASEELGLRREAVREAFLHAWQGYCRYAWGGDELPSARPMLELWWQ